MPDAAPECSPQWEEHAPSELWGEHVPVMRTYLHNKKKGASFVAISKRQMRVAGAVILLASPQHPL